MSFVKALSASLLAVGLIAAVAPSSAFAESATMKTLDPDHDGTVSLDEAKTAAEAKFMRLDTDKDSTVDAKEAKGVMSTSGVKTTDGDNDGTLDKAEYMSAVESAFKAADTDNDGTLDAKELHTAAGKKLEKLIK